MKLYISEILDKFEEKKTRKAKVAYLKEHAKNDRLAFLMQGAFDPKVKWGIDITSIKPTWTPDDAPMGMNPSNLYVELPKCSIFVKGHPRSKGLDPAGQEAILTQVLESMHAGESLLYEQMLQKKLKVKGLTSKIVLEVWPKLYQEGV